MNKIINIDQVKNLTKILRRESKSIVLAGGCFDFLHIGHITFLEKAKHQAAVLMVLLESDESIKKRKGIARPIHNQKQRAILLSALRFVDIVVMLPTFTSDKEYDNLVKQIQPAIIATTKPNPNVKHIMRQAREVGAKIVYVNKLLQGVSTSTLLETLAEEL